MKSSSKQTKTKRKPRLKHIVCKPCWEIKYCPYGPLVEQFPLVDDSKSSAKAITKMHRKLLDTVSSGSLKSSEEIYYILGRILYSLPERWSWIEKYDTSELSCSVFGHICPVFFSAEPFTETKEDRRTTRFIPRSIMFKVVRRDGQVCAICKSNVPDDEIEFDHVIPKAHGGPSTVENLRVLCRGCNRKKSAGLDEILSEEALQRKKEMKNSKKPKSAK